MQHLKITKLCVCVCVCVCVYNIGHGCPVASEGRREEERVERGRERGERRVTGWLVSTFFRLSITGVQLPTNTPVINTNYLTVGRSRVVKTVWQRYFRFTFIVVLERF